MATLYFNGAVDDQWSEIGNWWEDAAHTIPASGVPAVGDHGDSVVVTASMSGSGFGSRTLVNFTADGNINIAVSIVVTGLAKFDNGVNYSGSLITGNAEFNDNSLAYSTTITGNLTLNDNANASSVTVTGNVTLYGYAILSSGSTVTGDVTAYDSSSVNISSGTGNITLYDDAITAGVGSFEAWVGDVTYYDDSALAQNPVQVDGKITFRDRSRLRQNISRADDGVVFDDDASIRDIAGEGLIQDDYTTVTFRGRSYNRANIAGNVTVIIDYAKGVNGSSILGVV